MSAPAGQGQPEPREERRLTRRTVVAAGAVAAAGTGIGMGVVLSAGGPSAPKLAGRLRAPYQPGVLPAEDPRDGAWAAAAPVAVAVQPQQIAPPFLREGFLEEILVRALHNGKELGFLVEWDDPALDELSGINIYNDAIAIQLPARAGRTPPSVTMGGPGEPVHILQWRATWQRDLDRGRTGPQTLHPRIIRDLTPEDLLGPEGKQYDVGYTVGNPMSTPERSRVEEVVAEGFGTVTHLSRQRARGGGAHASGRWTVAVAVPMERAGAGDPIRPGSSWPVAFAVWLGSRRNRGSRKHWANWVRIDLDPL